LWIKESIMKRRNFLNAFAALSDDRHVAVTTRARFERGGRP
jgi:hypothetical protein